MSRRRRIWHLLSNRWNSAITEYALSTARALKDQGHATLFSPLADSPAEDRARQYFECEAFAKFGVTEMGRAFALADEYRPDVVITYGGPETFLASILKRSRDMALVRFRGQDVDTAGFGPSLKHRLAHRFVDLVLTPSKRLADAVQRLDASARVASVTLGIDTEAYRRIAAPPAARPELLIFGRLDPVKGHHAALRIMAKILATWPKDFPRPRLHIAGQPANVSRTHIEQWVKESQLVVGDDVLLTLERVADVPTLLSRATLGWVPSLGSEIICRVAEEFLACGTPVALSGAGSLDETLFDGAGFSYGGKSEDETARLFSTWLPAVLREDESAKATRAATARALFSLETMGNSLTDRVLTSL